MHLERRFSIRFGFPYSRRNLATAEIKEWRTLGDSTKAVYMLPPVQPGLLWQQDAAAFRTGMPLAPYLVLPPQLGPQTQRQLRLLPLKKNVGYGVPERLARIGLV